MLSRCPKRAAGAGVETMKKRILILAGVGAVSMVVTIALILAVEADHNDKINGFFDALWWWVVTSTTVGYGDIVPVTPVGRVVAMFAILTGFYLYTNFVALVAESVHEFTERHAKGRVPVTIKGHILICEYTAMADELIQGLPSIDELKDVPVVVATDLVGQNPYPQHLYVSGVPINPAVLKQANCAHASMVFIFANFRFADPDVKTLHIASRVREQNPGAAIFVEMVDDNSELLKFVPGGLIVIPSRRVMEYVLKHVPFNPLEWVDEEKRKELVEMARGFGRRKKAARNGESKTDAAKNS